MSKKILLRTKNKNYNIIIGKYTLKKIKKFLNYNKKTLYIIIVDSNVYSYHKKYILNNTKELNSKIIIFNTSEKNKSINGYKSLIQKIFKHSPDRKTKIIIIGGGMLGDLGGFIASTILRGLDLILIPTTLLSQADSSIGGKNGINNQFGKNLIGTFYQPNLVIIDTNFLKSLSKKQIKSGYSEIFKHSLIKNKKYFLWLEKNHKKVISLNNLYLLKALYESIKIKSLIVSADEKENLNSSNSRALLNFGHTIGHALEAMNNYKANLTHGEAISIGMIYAANLSVKLNYLTHDKKIIIEKHLKNVGLPTRIKIFNQKKLFQFIAQDKKNHENKIKFILLKDIGKAFVSKNLTLNDIKKNQN